MLELSVLNLTLLLRVSIKIYVPNQFEELQANNDVEKYCAHKLFGLGNNMFTNNLFTKL